MTDQQLTDSERESLIEICTLFFSGASTQAVRRFWWAINLDLIKNRSPERIAVMEKAMGLES